MIGMSLHCRRRRQSSSPSPSGSSRSTIAASTGESCHDVERLSHVCSGQDRVSGAPQDHLQGAQDLLLVIAGQNPPAG